MDAVVSIIIPNYNHADYLKQRIESVINQNFQDFELILLDDASTDGSLEILKKYKNHPKVSHFVINERNSGSPFKQWEKGIKLARGKYIWIAESDDWSAPDFLEKLYRQIIKDKCDLVYCRSLFSFEDESKNRKDDSYTFLDNERWEYPYSNSGDAEVKNFMLFKNTITNASAVLFRNDISSMPFSEIVNMRYCGDWYFWSVYLRGKSICYLPETLNHFKCHDHSTRETKEINESLKRIREIIFVMKSIKKHYDLKILPIGKLINYKWLNIRINEIEKIGTKKDVKKAMNLIPFEIRCFLNLNKFINSI